MKTRVVRLGLILGFVLCVVISWALSHTAQGGFNVDPALENNVILNLAICAVAQAVLFYGVLRPQRKLLCHIVYIVLAVVACIAAVALSPSQNPIDDTPQNYFVALLCLELVNLLVFELSRKHFTCLLLFGLGGLFCGYIQFLYTTNMLVTTAVFLVATIMLIILRTYMDMVVDSGTETAAPLLGKATATGLLFPLAALGLAAVVVIGVIMPLNPPHATIKLQTEYMSYEEESVQTGVKLDNDSVEERTSSNIDESLPERTTTDKKKDDSSSQQLDKTESQQQKKDYLSDDYSDVNLSGAMEGLTAIALNPSIPWPAIIAGIVALLILLLLLPRYIIHKARLRKIAAMPGSEQIAALYAFFLSRFKKLGFAKPGSLTPIEYANLYRERLYPFVGAQEACTFDHLTALYVWRGYGNQEVGSGDLECMHYLYNIFYDNCRKELGLFKYLFRYITL